MKTVYGILSGLWIFMTLINIRDSDWQGVAIGVVFSVFFALLSAQKET